MKQSKYSKRRPTHGLPYTVDKVKKTPYGNYPLTDIKQRPSEEVSYPKGTLLPEYDAMIFLDDKWDMSPQKTIVANAKEYHTVRNFRDFVKIIHTLIEKGTKTLFVSFDHYLAVNEHCNGMDCLKEMYFNIDYRGGIERVDITGHSSDPSMNEEKQRYWNDKCAHLGSYITRG